MHETESKLSDAEVRLRELEASLRKSEGLTSSLRTQAEEAQQREAAAKVPYLSCVYSFDLFSVCYLCVCLFVRLPACLPVCPCAQHLTLDSKRTQPPGRIHDSYERAPGLARSHFSPREGG